MCHCREWTSPVTCLGFLHRLASLLASPSTTLARLRYSFLVLNNPDGYEFSMAAPAHRLTRKNRNLQHPCNQTGQADFCSS